MNYLGAQPTGIMAAMPMPAQAAMGQFAITDPDSPMGIQSLAGGQEELAERLRAMGVPKYGLGKLFRKVVPKEVRKVAAVAIPFLPVDPVTKAIMMASLTKLEGGSTKDALINAGTAYIAGNLPGADAAAVTPGYVASVAALQAGAAKLKGADTRDALKQGVISAATAGALKGFAGTETGQEIFGKISAAGDAITPDFLKAAQPAQPSLDTTGLENAIDTGDVLGTDSLLSDLSTSLNVEAPSTIQPNLMNIPTGGEELFAGLTGDVGSYNLTQPLSVTSPRLGLTGNVTDDITQFLNTQTSLTDLTGNVADTGLTGDIVDTRLTGDVSGKLNKSLGGEGYNVTGDPKPVTGDPKPVTGDADPTFFEKLKSEIGDLGKNLTFGGDEPLKDFAGSAALVGGPIALLAGLGMDEPGMEGGSPFTEEQAAAVASYLAGTGSDPIYAQRAQTFADFYNQRRRAMGLNEGGEIVGPGTGTSDSVPALLSDGEFVMTAKAVRNAGGGNREKGAAKMYALMNKLEQGAA